MTYTEYKETIEALQLATAYRLKGYNLAIVDLQIYEHYLHYCAVNELILQPDGVSVY